MTTEHEIPLIATSSELSGAIRKSPDGSSFSILLEDSIDIPKNATSAILEVQEATIWNTSPNILEGKNDKFYFEYLTFNHVITIPQGLYSLGDLNSTLDREIESILGIVAEGLIILQPDAPTQKVNIRLAEAELQIDFTQPDTFRNILGFTSQLVPSPNPSLGIYNQLGDSIANFNSIDFFLVHSDIADRGMRINNKYDQTIAQVLIDVPPGSQIISRPFNPPKIGCWSLINGSRKDIRFWLTDQDGAVVNTNDENWSIRMVIKYKQLHEDKEHSSQLIRSLEKISDKLDSRFKNFGKRLK